MKLLNKTKRACFLLLVLIIFITITGCAAVINLTEDDDITKSQRQLSKIPIRVGIYLSKAFRNYSYELNLGLHMHVNIGPSMSNEIEKNINGAFEKVLIVSELSSKSQIENVDVIISSEVIDTTIRPAGTGYAGIEGVIKCKWTIIKPNGEIVYTTTIIGKGTDDSLVGMIRVRKCFYRAMRNQVEQFMLESMKSRWWEHMNK